MSADNGIYILESPAKNNHNLPEYRIVETTNIDDIWYEPNYGLFNGETLIAYFGKCKVFDNVLEANEEAVRIEKECMFTQYGINYITMNRGFPQ